MPIYEYECAHCGPFEDMQPMARSGEPSACPACGASAPRVMLTAPRLAMMDAGRRTAFATNERSAHVPHYSTKDSRAGGHGPGCSCCSSSKGKRGRKTAVGRDGSKSFPSARPWMISH